MDNFGVVMRAKNIKLKNFRNFSELNLDFEPGLAVITGQNGEGKTNILEAIYLTSIGRSPRTRQDNLLIKKGESEGCINLEYIRAETSRNLGVNLSQAKGKSVVIDGIETKKISSIVGNFSCVYFSPDEIEIVRGGPQYRRRFMDIINCQISQNYMQNLKLLQQAVKQRNAILKTLKLASEYDINLIPWDTQIINYSYKIMLKRIEFIKSLQNSVDKIMRILTDGKETLKLSYKTFVDTENFESLSLEKVENFYNQKARTFFFKDVLSHTSSIGVHLDDFDIKLGYLKKYEKNPQKIEFISLRNEGSLGQQRTATLALKIAEIFMYQEFYGEKPMLLLDDVLSELDENRRSKLMQYCKEFDTIVTCTEWEEKIIPDYLLEVKNGSVLKK